MAEFPARIRVLQDTAANFATHNPVLLLGEWGFEIDTKKIKIGDGASGWNDLVYKFEEVLTSAEKTKLAGIEAAATSDQTGSEIKSAYEAEEDTNAFTDVFKAIVESIAKLAPQYQTIPIPAGAMYACGTDGAKPVTGETPTNKINLDYFAFDAGATEEKVQFLIPAMPENWDRGTVKVYFLWGADLGSSVGDKVTWAVKAGAFSNDEHLDGALGTPRAVEDALLAVSGSDWQKTVVAPALTIGGTPALGDVVLFEVFRDTDGSVETTDDDMAEDSFLFGCVIQIKLNNTVSAW